MHAIASLGRDGATPVKLAIAGAALAAAVSSWTSGILLTDRKTMESFRFWQVGTVGGRGLDVLLTGLPFLVLGAVLALAGARLLNALALGDDLARGLGRRTAVDGLVIGLARGAARRRRHRAGRADRVRRPARAARGAAGGRLGLRAGCCRSARWSARCSWCSPTRSAGWCCRRPRCRSAS